MLICVTGKPFGGRNSAAKCVTGCSVITIPPAWMPKWCGMPMMRLPCAITAFATLSNSLLFARALGFPRAK